MMANYVEPIILAVLLLMSIVGFYVYFQRLRVLKRIEIYSFKSRSILEKELTKGLTVLASVASTSPYIGLLGTVLGIMQTFYVIGERGYADTLQIMVGLSLALKATAAGLLVAIPATLLYNHLARKVREIILEWEAKNGREGDM